MENGVEKKKKKTRKRKKFRVKLRQITVAREIHCPSIEISPRFPSLDSHPERGRIMPVHRLAGRLSNQA